MWVTHNSLAMMAGNGSSDTNHFHKKRCRNGKKNGIAFSHYPAPNIIFFSYCVISVFPFLPVCLERGLLLFRYRLLEPFCPYQ